MKRKIFTAAAALMLFACNNEQNKDGMEATRADSKVADSSSTNKATKDHSFVMPDSATMMKNWQEYMTPGDMHKMMASWSGSWTGETSMWHAPDAPPEKSLSTAQNKMIMGGRYQQAMHSGNMMGMPFEGMSLLAYDNATKKFTTTWIDNAGTGIMKLEGDWDAAGKTMTLTGSTVNIMTGDGRSCDIREVFKVIDDNTQVMEMYGYSPEGKEYKMMEIKYTRKK
jgi:hypothetical protein